MNSISSYPSLFSSNNKLSNQTMQPLAAQAILSILKLPLLQDAVQFNQANIQFSGSKIKKIQRQQTSQQLLENVEADLAKTLQDFSEGNIPSKPPYEEPFQHRIIDVLKQYPQFPIDTYVIFQDPTSRSAPMLHYAASNEFYLVIDYILENRNPNLARLDNHPGSDGGHTAAHRLQQYFKTTYLNQPPSPEKRLAAVQMKKLNEATNKYIKRHPNSLYEYSERIQQEFKAGGQNKEYVSTS